MSKPRKDCWPGYTLDDQAEIRRSGAEPRHVWTLPVRVDRQGQMTLDPACPYTMQTCLRCGMEWVPWVDDDDDDDGRRRYHPDTPPIWSPSEPIPEEQGGVEAVGVGAKPTSDNAPSAQGEGHEAFERSVEFGHTGDAALDPGVLADELPGVSAEEDPMELFFFGGPGVALFLILVVLEMT